MSFLVSKSVGEEQAKLGAALSALAVQSHYVVTNSAKSNLVLNFCVWA